MSGTDTGYAATREVGERVHRKAMQELEKVLAYAPAMRSPVLIWRVMVRSLLCGARHLHLLSECFLPAMPDADP
eukprot:640092-Rhodomonas_salina.2